MRGGFATRYLAASTPLLRSLNEACFPLYVLHMPILTILAYFIVRWEAPGIAQFVILVALTGLATFALYKTCIQRITLMCFLFGLRPSTLPSRPSLDLAHAHGDALLAFGHVVVLFDAALLIVVTLHFMHLIP